MTHALPDGQPAFSGGDMLTAVVVDLSRMITDRRGPALADESDAVHQLRTSVRRMRNVLAAFGPCFDEDLAEKFAVVLAAYGGLLGECRDLEVRAADAAAALEATGQGDLYDSVVAPLLADHDRAHAALVVWHRAGGAESLDALLAHWSAEPPLTSRADRPATKVAVRAVRRQLKRVLDRVDRLGGEDTAEAEEAVHALRRAARRLRHTADAVEGVDGVDGAARVGDLGQRIQGLLGDHRDAVLLADHVRQCAAGVADRTSYDRVIGHAVTLADDAMAGLDGALADLRGVVVP
ncbi:CHAD domain-containing protein [Nocardioides sp. WS12]|uniref:CHAD domain-containing protein n=1 Tax=Nocardioides sp. WS12 TaxID=2486272 RepID=UPI0015FD845B|nr:CHAD domain-containing protein [Nocardioides sp. WS12]